MSAAGPAKLLRQYSAALDAHPLLVKACTSALSFGLADVLAQAHERRQRRLQPLQHEGETLERGPLRTLRGGAFGLLFHGPWIHMAWGNRIGLERFFPGNSWPRVITRILIDQTVSMPVVYVAFLSWPALTTWQGVDAAADNVRRAFWPAVTFAWSVWPAVHMVNFKWVPLRHRLLVTNVVALGVFSYATFVSDRTRAHAEGLADTPATAMAEARGAKAEARGAVVEARVAMVEARGALVEARGGLVEARGAMMAEARGAAQERAQVDDSAGAVVGPRLRSVAKQLQQA